MNIRSYWTPLDHKIFKNIKRIISNFKKNIKGIYLDLCFFLRNIFSLSFYEVLFFIILILGIGIRLLGMFSSSFLLEEGQLISQSIEVSSFLSAFKYTGDSFCGVLLIIPTILTMVYGISKSWFSVHFILRPEEYILWISPLFIWAGRLFGLLIFTLTLFVFYKFGKRFFNKQVGIIAALLFAFSPLSIQSSRLVLSQNLGVLLTATILYALYLWYENRSLIRVNPIFS